jgi:predicted DNA-binding protein (MmcQ/YjbR family)
MTASWVRNYCLSLPGVTENIQWGNDLLFKIGGKMFVVTGLEPDQTGLSLKCTPETFSELTAQVDITPSKYLARAHWVSIQSANVLPREELKRLIRTSYQLVFDKLPRKTQASIQGTGNTSAVRKPAHATGTRKAKPPRD